MPLLIAKSIVEALFVVALVAVFYLTVFKTNFRGLTETNGETIAGWVVDDSAPFARVETQLYVDDRFIAASPASLSRPGLTTAGLARDEWHGFNFDLSSLNAGSHIARVYAAQNDGGARRTLELIGNPVRFETGARETNRSSDQSKQSAEARSR
ncbi:MAG: hypothetical protein ABR577_02565 [Pyrinomonadaceae bacterium]